MSPINPVDSLGVQSAYVSVSSREATAERRSPDTDTIRISDEAFRKMEAEAANQAMVRQSIAEANEGKSAWKLSSGLQEGRFTLKNGNIQTVSIDDGVLTIEEFQGDKLIKSVTGTITESGAVLDTEHYDSMGRVSQTIHTEISLGDDDKGWTSAVMTRDIAWFEGGKLKGDMHEDVGLRTKNHGADKDDDAASFIRSMLDKGTKALDTEVESIAAQLTIEQHALNYFAQIREYNITTGNVARDITVEQDGEYKQLSNRKPRKVDELEGRTTRELTHKTGLHISVKDYDGDGELLRDASFSDISRIKQMTGELGLPKATPVQEQAVDVSWYNKGELVKRSHGSMIQEATDSLRLADRPGFLEMFGMDEEEYLGREPKSAMELMTTKIVSNASDANMFLNGLAEHVNDHDYSQSEGIAEYGERKRPYSASWTDEIYRDGKLAMRQQDSEGAREPSVYQQSRAIHFRTGGGLTENASPAVLRESSHEREVFDRSGNSVSHQFMEAREYIDMKMDAPDELRTASTFSEGVEGRADTTVINSDGGLGSVDSDINAATRGLSAELEQTLDILYGTITHLNRGETDKYSDYRVRLDFRP